MKNGSISWQSVLTLFRLDLRSRKDNAHEMGKKDKAMKVMNFIFGLVLSARSSPRPASPDSLSGGLIFPSASDGRTCVSPLPLAAPRGASALAWGPTGQPSRVDQYFAY